MSMPGDQRQLIQQAFLQLEELKRKWNAAERARTEPIALVGMGCRFPGPADSPAEFWELLRAGRDAVAEIPAERWNVDDYFDPDPQHAGTVYTRHAALLSRRTIEDFDPQFFGIAPREAAAMDPQQRLLLEVCWNALEHAGIPLGDLRGSATGLYVGMCTDDYLHLHNNLKTPQRIDGYTSLGTARSIAVGRVSYLMGWEGPALQLDTACSSALMAVHLACQSLRLGECNLALAGAVNLQLSPVWTVGLCRLRALSPSGRCRAFDADADGFVRGEGCGIVVLKRLSDAQRDGDAILAVIRGSAVNHDGKSGGLTVPNERAQQKLLTAALANAKVKPADVSYIEAHGTGTLLGDPIEMGALRSVFAEHRDASRPLLVGSVKTNVGHLEGAAGVASLMKVVLATQHREIPGSLHFHRPNPLIPWKEFPVQVPTKSVPWPENGARKIAGISAFGFSGTNVHLIVESPPENSVAPTAVMGPERPVHVLPLSAKTPAALTELAKSYQRLLAEHPGESLANWGFSAGTGRTHFGQRLAVVASTTDEAQEKLERHLADPASIEDGIVAGEGLAAPQVAWLFPAETGSSLRSVNRYYAASSAFREAWDKCCRIAAERLPEIAPAIQQRTGEAWERVLASPESAIPAAFIQQYCLSQMWHDWGVPPAMVAGCGVGAYAAAVAAGVLSLEDALQLTIAEGRARRSGNHSDFASAAQAVLFQERGLPIVSDVTGAIAGTEISTADYWARRYGKPTVPDLVAPLRSKGMTFAVEMGPQGSFAADLSTAASLSANRDAGEDDDLKTLVQGVAKAYAHGVNIAWRRFDADHPRQRKELPTYPFQRTRCWLESEESTISIPERGATVVEQNIADRHPLLGFKLDAAADEQVFELHVTPRTEGLWRDHCIYGQPILPATAYLELALAAVARSSGGHGAGWIVQNLSIEQALKLPAAADDETPEAAVTVQSVLSPRPSGWECRIFSRRAGETAWQRHATAQLAANSQAKDRRVDLAALRTAIPQPVDLGQHYAGFQKTGLELGPRFHALHQLFRGDGEALAEIRLPEALLGEIAEYCVHPVLLDASLQALAAVIPRAGMYLPVGIGELKLHAPLGSHIWCHARLVPSVDSGNRGVTADVELFDDEGRILGEMCGVQFREVPREALGRSRTADMESLLYRLGWQPQPLSMEQRLSGPGRWLVLEDDSGIGERLAKFLRLAGHRCIRVAPGRGVGTLVDDRIELPPSDADAFASFLRQQNGQPGSWTGVVHLWGLRTPAAGKPGRLATPSSAAPDQVLGCGSVLAMVRALIRQGESPKLCLVTRQAQSISDDDGPLNFLQSALWGLGRTIALEHPDLNCRCIDLDDNEAAECADQLWHEIQSADGENQIAYRRHERYVARLERAVGSRTKLSIPDEPFRLQLPTYGLLDRFRAEPNPPRAPQPGEVTVEIRASGLNFRDVLRSLGMLQNYEQSLGIHTATDATFGFEASGAITALGAGVTNFTVGDEVVVMDAGTLASHLTVSARHVALKPPNLSFTEAASLPLAFVTAQYALEELAQLRAGQRVLIHAAAGGVGLSAVQLALKAGAEVYATASPGKCELLRSLGVKFVANSRNTDFADEILRATDGAGVDVVLNSLNGDFIPASLKSLRRGGLFIEIGKIGIWTTDQMAQTRPDVTYQAFDLGDEERKQPGFMGRRLSELLERFGRNELTPLPIKTFPLADVSEAFRWMSQAKHVGKVVIDLERASPTIPATFDSGTYLVTGGLGGLGRLVCRWLVGNRAKSLAIVGRRPAETDDQQHAISELEQQGCLVRCFAADVSQADDVARVLQSISAEMPPLAGVIHAAGVLDDGAIRNQTPSRFEAVFGPKALGAWHLHEQTRDLPLKHFVCFSSAVSLLGSPGQANYAAANAFVDGLCQSRRRSGLPGLSINWGAWKGAGMAAQLGVRERERLAAMGLGGIEPDTGLSLLGDLMSHASTPNGPAQTAVLLIDWQRYAASVGRQPLLANLLGEAASPARQSEFLRQWEATPVGDRGRLLKAFLRGQLAKVLGLDPNQPLAADQGFFDLGMDSLTSVEFANRLQDGLGAKLATTVAFDYPTLDRLSEFLMNTVLPQPNEPAQPVTPEIRIAPAVPPPSSSPPAEPDGVAIIGMSCRFPGCEAGPDAYWEFLLQGGDAVCDVPPQRWDADRLTDSNPDAPGKMTSRKGGFLKQPVDQFDAAFFGIAPREARSLDPQQRLLLETTCEAFEDAGIPIDKLEKSNAGVFMGIAGSDYLMQMARNRDAIDAYFGTGTTHSTAAGRLSYTFGLQGPAISVDTACSSGLVAIHLACQSLENGECDFAVAAGVNLILAPEVCINFSKARMLSPDGHCKSFDASANGYVRGEGVGVLLLKPLSKAQADGDRILGVIRGTAINQDGRSGGLTVPSGPAQEAVLRQAMRVAGVSADDIDYLEAHGTGTALGDPIELSAIGAAYRSRQGAPLTVCSVKANIGHLETASGVAGLIKVLMAMRHQQIPRQLHFQEPNPKVDWSQLPISIPQESKPWPTGSRRRIAAVSAFGFSGTNAHVVVEEPPVPVEQSSTNAGLERPLQLLVLSAKSETALKDLARTYASRLADCSDHDFINLCHTAAAGRAHFAYRLAVIGSNAAAAKTRLEKYLAGEGDPQVQAGYVGDPPQVAFLFTGQGSQYVGMGRTLFETQPKFRAALEKCDQILRPLLPESLLSVMFAETPNGLLDQTAYTQPALFSLEYALCEMWRSWGVEPSVMLGHSVGEYAAACAAGVLPLEDALTLIATRARLIQSLPAGGGMLAVMAHEDQVRPIVERHPQISFAAINGPRQVVLSGPIPALDQLAGELSAANLVSKRLVVSHAFHSSLMEPILQEFESAAKKLNFSPPRIPIISNVTAQTVNSQSSGDELRSPDYWRQHLRNAVQFSRSIDELAKSPCDVLLEIGPQPTLLGMAKHCLPGDKHVSLASLKLKIADWETVLATLSQLYVRGADIDWAGFDRGYHRQRIAAPTYPFQRMRHWPEWLTPDNISSDLIAKTTFTSGATSQNGAASNGAEIPAAVNGSAVSKSIAALSRGSAHPLLGGRLQLAGEHLAYQAEISADSPAYLADHSVFGRPLFPGAGFMETALAAAHQLPGTDPVIVEDLELIEGLPLPKGIRATVQIVLDGEGSDRQLRYFSRSNKANADDKWVLHATAKLHRGEPASGSAVNLDSIRRRCDREIDVAQFYADFLKAGLQYGPSFQGVHKLRGGAGEAIGELRLPTGLSQDAGAYFLHPTMLDAALQVLAGAMDGVTATYLPVGLEALRFHHRLPNDAVCHVRLRDPDATDAPMILADIKLLNPAGQTLAVLHGLKLKRVNLPAAKTSPAAAESGRERVEWLHEFVWRPQPLMKEATSETVKGTWLVFGDDSDVGALVARQLQARGGRCVLIQPGQEFRQFNLDQFEVNPADPAGFQRLLQEAVGQRMPSLQGVVFLWGLAESESEMMASLSTTCGGALHLVQALMKSETRPRVWLVTRGGQAVAGQESVVPAEAAVWGMGRVIAAEHPDLRCTRIDLDPAADEPSSVQLLMKDILAADDEDQLAYRNGNRLALRLVKQSTKLGRLSIPSEPFRLKLSEYGGLDRFSLAPIERTTPGPGEIEVAVEASGLNFRDVLRALGMLQSYEAPLGITSADLAPFGFEFAGRVSAVGPGVTGLAVGDEVLGVHSGTLQTHLVCPALHVVRKPQELSATAAASIPLAFLTATYGLDHLAKIQPGDNVLIHAAAGGVGQAAVQIARRAGATVFATASPGKWDFLREQGIEHIFDSRSTDFGQQILEATGGRGVDVVLNSLNGDFIPASVAALAPQGRFVEIGKIGIWTTQQMAAARPDVKYWAFDLGEVEEAAPGLMQRLLDGLMPDFVSGKLTALPGRVYAVDDSVSAFREMQQAKHRGKLVLAFDPRLVDNRPTVRGDASYVITGGLGGLGLSLAERLVQRGARHLVLAGRRGAESPEQHSAIANLQSAGAEVSVVQANVGDAADVERLVAAAQKLAPLKGVFHAAGVLDDGLIGQQSWSRFEKVLGPKAIGAWHLHRATQKLDLDLFVNFSSAAAMIGSFGQSNYAAANAFLDGLSWQRRGAGLAAVSVNWGPWGGKGMAARMEQRDLDRMAQSGWSLIGIEEGLDLLERILRGNSPQVGVLPVDWSVFLSMAGGMPMLRELAAGNRPAEKSSFVVDFEAAAESERRELMVNYVRNRIASVLGSDSSDWIQPRDRLFDLGMDSLTAVEMQNSLQRELGLVLPTTLAFDFPTIEALADYLTERVMENAGAEAESEQTPVVPPLIAEPPVYTSQSAESVANGSPPTPVVSAAKPAESSEAEQLRQIENLSDEEVSALLLSNFGDLLS